jgi:hypothetical protein
MKKSVLVAMIAVALVSGLAAQANLGKSTSLPRVDGTIAPSEYQYAGSSGGMKIYATLGSDDMLYLAVESPAAGYAAAGVGGLVMNGSRLFFGAVQDGKPAFQEKLGKGHFYTDAKDLVVKSWSVKTSGNDTVLELSLPASAALWNGKVNSIFAYSKSTKFDSRHSGKASVSFVVK